MNRRRRSLPRLAAASVAGLVAACGLLAGVSLTAATSYADETASPSPSASATPSPSSDPRDGLEGAADLTPVTGSSKGSSAPPIESGRYVDTAPGLEDFRFYRFQRTLPGSTIAFGATMLGPDVDPRKRLVVRLYVRGPAKPDGERRIIVCGVARVGDSDKAKVMPVSSVAGWSYAEKPLCQSSTEVFVGVRNTVQPFGADEPRLLVPEAAPYELDVWEQPAITNADQMKQAYNNSWVYDDAGTPAVQADPGVSPSTAVPLEPGQTAAVDLVLGRVAWFAVPVALGDRLQVLVETADGAVAAGAGFEARIYSPVGGAVLAPDPAVDPPAPNVGNLVAGPNLFAAITEEVDPGNRVDNEGSSYSQHSALAAAAGRYLVAVYVQKLSGSQVRTLPITVRTRLDPHAGYEGEDRSKPVYASPMTEFPAPTGAKPVPYVAERVSTDGARPVGRSAGDWLLIGGLGAAALAFAGLGGVLLRRRS